MMTTALILTVAVTRGLMIDDTDQLCGASCPSCLLPSWKVRLTPGWASLAVSVCFRLCFVVAPVQLWRVPGLHELLMVLLNLNLRFCSELCSEQLRILCKKMHRWQPHACSAVRS